MSRLIVNIFKLNTSCIRNKSLKSSTILAQKRNFQTQNRFEDENFVIESPYENKIIPYQRLTDFIFDELEEEISMNNALTCGLSGRSYNFTMLNFLINKFAQSILSQFEIVPRETVGLLLPNIPEFAITVHGALKAGLIVTFVNPLYKPDEISRQFQNANVKMIVTVPQLIEVAVQVGKTLQSYKGTINIGGEDEAGRRIFGLESMLIKGGEADLPETNIKETAVLPYSSGTTGVPKGVMLSHYNLVANLVQVDHPDFRLESEFKNPLKIFTVLPFFHIFGFNSIMNASLKFRSHLITLPKFTPESFLKCLIDYEPKALFVVPSLMTFLTENSKVEKDHLKSVEIIRSGAAPLSEGLIERFRLKFGKSIDIKQGYGMTESSPVTVSVPKNAPLSKHASIGVLVPNTLGKIIDLTTGAALGPNNPGELLVKGPQVMLGYLNNEKATKETVDEDGWLRTGDVVYYDGDGYIFIIDRCKELIKVKGNQVSPTELESLILGIPDVEDVAVIGIPDAAYDEVPKAFVVKKPGSELNEKEIQEYVDCRVVHYKKLSGGVTFLDTIPRNPSGKILRNELKVMKMLKDSPAM